MYDDRINKKKMQFKRFTDGYIRTEIGVTEKLNNECYINK